MKKKIKILIIGGTGYLGFNLIKRLNKKNFIITSISRNKVLKKKKISNIHYINCDVSKKKELKKIKKDFEIIFNFCGNVDHKNRLKTIKNHFISCKNLVDYFKNSNLKKFFQIGSGLEYKDTKKLHSEKDQLKPKGFYGLAKKKASLYCLKSNRDNDFPATILRLYQIYGPSQDFNRLIPKAIFSLKKNQLFESSHGEQFRDFLFIDDLIDVFLKLIHTRKKIKGEIFNIGTGKPIKVKKVLQLVQKRIKKGKILFGALKLRRDEPMNLVPQTNKIRKFFNWRPRINLIDGIRKSIRS